jgi:hypothetical protein
MKFCDKHKQEYMDHVPVCPICLGEKMIDYTHTEAPDVHRKALNELNETNRSNRNQTT